MMDRQMGVGETQRINFSWLIRLRWGTLAGQLGTILVVQFIMGIRLPLLTLLVILSIQAATNLVATIWLRNGRQISDSALASTVGLDVLFLTAQLFLTGGSFNPFNFLYLVHIALAAVVLPPRWTWGLVSLSLACSAFLFYGEGTLGFSRTAPHSHADQMAMHMKGMWVAFAVAAVFIVYFVGRVRRSLADRENDLARERAAATRNERLAALATLAAGAAHELATPLGTIAITAREIERRSDRGEPVPVDDARLIRAQVDRCRGILDHLATDAGAAMGEAPVRVPLKMLIHEALRDLRGAVTTKVEGNTNVEVDVPPRALARAIRTVIKNGYEAAPGTDLTLRIDSQFDVVRLVVSDLGPGMDQETLARVGEPFFTTKTPGHGMGLGLFLATTVIKKLGGHLVVESWLGKGTQVTMSLPLASDVEGANQSHGNPKTSHA
jgi:two-component system sensor histidine kinase RegB